MTHALPAAVDQTLARARDNADDAAPFAAELVAAYPDRRAYVVNAVAIDLLGERGCCPMHMAYTAAELAVRLAEQTPTPALDEPIPYVPALDDIRLASDYPGFGG